MNIRNPAIALLLSLTILINSAPPARACGPSYIEPIFVFKESPDLPFAEYARGKIGIVQPTHGRKTLFIAFRYLNGGNFNATEQQALVEALNGKAPEDEDFESVKAWINARGEVVSKDEKTPEIYTEHEYGGYAFFPNCSRNAFEVATQTLKERAARYGSDDQNVRSWLAAQDTVFQNCNGGAGAPAEVGPQGPAWLRKDRDYQIAAAYFYSLNFDEARARFEKIAQDSESEWQQTADYLVARTLVRQASLTDDAARKKEIYEQAVRYLQSLADRTTKFHEGAANLLSLVKFRVHPEQRVHELAQTLSSPNANANLRQNLIDYVWLLDRFESRILKEEEKRKEALKPRSQELTPEERSISRDPLEGSTRSISDETTLAITFYLRGADGQFDYANGITINSKPDVSESEALRALEEKVGRKLSDDELKDAREKYDAAVKYRRMLLSPNHKWGQAEANQYEGCSYNCDRLTLAQMPDFLRADELSDWIFNIQTQDENAYRHAVERWRDSDSEAWLTAALIKADLKSPGLSRLLRQAERVPRESPAYPTLAYHLVRLRIAAGQTVAARKLLDEIISWQGELLPTSTQNQFLEQRFQLATSLAEFLKFAGRRPAAFLEEGRIGKMSELFAIGMKQWEPDGYTETKEEFERKTEERYQELIPWDNRLTLDDQTVDLFNWHFPLASLAAVARDPALPDYLQRRLVLATWTRAIILKNETVARQIAPEVIKLAPEMTEVFNPYLTATTAAEREHAALYVLLKFPDLSPLIQSGVPSFSTAEAAEYYFETSWWCTPDDTEYSIQTGNEVPKVVAPPVFLTPDQLSAAKRERAALKAIGDGKRYLGKQVLRWAATRPDDARLPEALYIAVKANESYKYGCSGWEADERTREKAETLLRERYPRSPWTAKLDVANSN